jgi:amidase
VSDLCFLSAQALAALIRSKQLSAREVMAAHLDRIRRVNPLVTAIVAKLDDDECLALAADADRKLARGDTVGPLHGLPWAFKDLEEAVGFPCTRGSPIYKDFLPSSDTVIVERLRHAGVIPIGKTNVPEFGMGSHTYNNVYGRTRNPYDRTKSAGGSSGGAAVALATGMLPLADGSDLGGSLRNPGNFNNVVGLRPSVGLVPAAPSSFPFVSVDYRVAPGANEVTGRHGGLWRGQRSLTPFPGFSVKGPMARSVADCAFLLSVMAGADPRDPACLPSNPADFAAPLDRDLKNTRVAWCPDLGVLPLDDEVRAVLDARRQTFVELGCIVEDAVPDLSDADDIFLTIRKWMSAHKYGALLDKDRGRIKPEAVEEVEAGRALTAADITLAMARHRDLLERMRRFHHTFEFIACAVNQIPPFDLDIDWPSNVAGVEMRHYVEWMKSAYWISVTCGPAISVPCGFTSKRLPVGIQLVGQPGHDFPLLQLAYGFETATKVGGLRPSV